MKTHPYSARPLHAAFTLLELMAVAAAMAIVAMVILPMFARPRCVNSRRINCVNNLKQIGLSFRIWAGDNGGKYPMAVPVELGGTLERVDEGLVWPHFAVMSNELSTPKILICRSDDRIAATNFASLCDTNISYFVCLEADETNPQLWLAGDRNITNQFKPVRGILKVPVNSGVGWTAKLHNRQGNVAMADGSVQQLSSARLRDSLRAQTNSFLRLAMPD